MDALFSPISSRSSYLRVAQDYRLSCDKRLCDRHQLLCDRMVAHKSAIIHQLGDSYAQVRGFYRLINNEKVKISDLINKHCQIRSSLLKGRHVLCLGDGVSWNMKAAHGRMNEEQQARLGVLENNLTPGMHSQVMLAIDAQSEEVLGLGDILLYNRSKRETKADKHRNRKLSYDQKESSKWSITAQNAQHHLQGCEKLTCVFDRDADRFETLSALLAMAQTEYVIRIKENRLVSAEGQQGRLEELLSQQAAPLTYPLHIKALNHWVRQGRARKKRKARTSNMELRWLRIDQIEVPTDTAKRSKMVQPIERPLYCVDVKEAASDVPDGETAVHWRLLTTHPVTNQQQAKQIIAYYQQRWHIEQLFRVCKKKGLDLESAQLETVEALMRLTVMSLAAGCQIMQINLARGNDRPGGIELVFDEQEIQLLEQLNEKYSGKTVLQQNPFDKDRVSWAWWILGRLGGWKGYFSQGPPGPISISRGMSQFQTYKQAWLLFSQSHFVYKE